MILCCRLDNLSCRATRPDREVEKGNRNRSDVEERYQCILRKESKATEVTKAARPSSEGTKAAKPSSQETKAAMPISEGTKAAMLSSEAKKVEEKELHGPVQGKTDAQ